MAEIITLSALTRDRAGKGAARAARRAGRVPAVVYGDEKSPALISVDPKDLTRALHRPGFFARVLDVDVGGTKQRVLPRDVQLHPVTDAPLHADFLRVSANTRITVGVPVVFEDQAKSPGLRRGGILNIVRHEIALICRADNIPDRLAVSLEGL
ncbi:MAG TPA: 50S ribosomal protein L25/general stress protein Ctc, partial [Stellaceae bacterium]|nr:50S ribosomal protein L25/general stress protein Ctc [Stellaceae bacterium]